MKTSLLLLLTLPFLIQCGGKTENKKSHEVPPIPEELSLSVTEKGQKITDPEVLEIQSNIGFKAKMVVPDPELLFRKNNLQNLSLQQKELELQSKDINSFNFLTDLRKNCARSDLTIDTKTSFPNGGDLDLENYKENDYFERKLKADMSGAACPVELEADAEASSHVVGFNNVTKNGSMRGTGAETAKVVRISDNYAGQFNSRGVIINSKVSALNIRQDIRNRTLVNFNINGKYLSLKSAIPFEGSGSTLLKKDKASGLHITETTVKMKLRFPKAFVSVDIYDKEISGDQTSKKTIYYVNGHEMPKAEFERIFGQNNPVLNTASSLAKTIN
jgi:hypothetical protein